MLLKKIFTLVCAALMTFSMANAKLIFQESFDGKNGEVGQLSAGETGSYQNPNQDFTSDNIHFNETLWWSFSGNSNYIEVAEGSLSYSGYQTGIGNKAYLWSTGADDVRSFSSQAIKSGKVYLGAIINVEALKQKADPDYIMCLGDHVNSKFVGRLYTKSVKEDDAWVGFKLGIAKNNESANYLHYSEEVFAPNTDILVIIEYEFVSGDQNDVVRLYINPTKATTEPTVVMCPDTATTGGIQQGANAKPDVGEKNGIFGAFLRQGTNTPKVYVDEIKVATAWDDLWAEGEGEQEEDDDTVENIAAMMASPIQHAYILKSQPVVVNVEGLGSDYCVTVQDESGAVIINDFMETRLLNDVKVGDKINKLAAMPIESNKFINGLPTAQLKDKATPTKVSEGNSVEPFEVTLAEVAKYGPALVQLTEVDFITAKTEFAAAKFEIKQDESEAKLEVLEGCDIIDEEIPAKADIKALVVKNVAEDVLIRISASADVTNRVERHETGVESIQNSELKSRKAIIDWQIVIIKGDKIYNVLGTEL